MKRFIICNDAVYRIVIKKYKMEVKDDEESN